MKLFKRTKSGFSLAELVLSIGIFSLIISSVGYFTIDSIRASRNNTKRIQAGALIQENLNALLLLKNENWSTIVQNTGTGAKHLQFSNNKYSLASGSSTQNDITTSFTINNAYRDGSGNLAANGTLDLHTRELNFTATWNDPLGGTKSTSSKIYINDWSTLKWAQTTQADFNSGTHDFTLTTNTAGGELQMESVLYADWCRPGNTTTNLDLSGQGNPNALSAIPNNAVIGTGGNASGLPFADISISDSDPPSLTVDGTYVGYKANGIFRELNYAYIATDTNSEEVVILNITGTPTYSGKFDAPGNGSGNAVVTSGNVGYMMSGDKLYNFDLTSKLGSRPPLYKNADNTARAIVLSGTGKKIQIIGNYAYVVTSSTTNQLQIINITDPANLTLAGQFTVTGQAGVDLYVKSDGTRVYLATAGSTTQREFWILNTTTKNSISLVGSGIDTNGMDPKGITVIEADNRALVVGHNGEEYQAFNISTETSVTKCGGAHVDLGINAVVGVTQANNNNYSYITTGDSNAEFKVIRGGPGGKGGPNGQGYTETANFQSQIFDTGSVATQYYSCDWTVTTPTGTNVKVQVRTADSLANIATATWVGSDGTSNTYFTESSGNVLSSISSLQNKRYIQYKVIFESDTVSTAILQSLNIYYQK